MEGKNLRFEAKMWMWICPFAEVGLIGEIIWLWLSSPFRPSILYLFAMLLLFGVTHFSSWRFLKSCLE